MVYLSDIAREYSLNEVDLIKFFYEYKNTASTPIPFTKDAMKGIGLSRSADKEFLIKAFVSKYRDSYSDLWNKMCQDIQAEEEMKAAIASAERERESALKEILITSGFNFDGYKVVKYSGYISGDDAVQIPRSGVFGSNNGQNLTDALVKIRRQALKELKMAAYDLGCNAVIGVDFDYLTLEPETATLTGGTLYEPYVICVTANGNAVVIEKDDSK